MEGFRKYLRLHHFRYVKIVNDVFGENSNDFIIRVLSRMHDVDDVLKKYFHD